MPVRLRKSGLSRLIAILGAWSCPTCAAVAEGAVAKIRACLADAPEPMDCAGLTVEPCVARPGGETTAGMVACIGAEAEAWDRILNEEYRSTMAALRAEDATGDVAAPDMKRAATLQEAQRAWIDFRDAECKARYAQWGSGTMRHVVGANCVMVETAERAIELRHMRQP